MLLLLIVLGFSLSGQTPYYLHFNKTNGLPCNEVYDLYQDSKGYMWIASDCGLYRFDGVNFVSFFNPDMSTRAGSNIREDALNRIWYKTFNGEVYYTDGDHLTRFTNNIIQGELILIDSFMVGHLGEEKGLVYNIYNGHLQRRLTFTRTSGSAYQIEGHFAMSYLGSPKAAALHMIYSVDGTIEKVLTPEPGNVLYRCHTIGKNCVVLEYNSENIFAFQLSGTKKNLLFTSPNDGVINGFDVKGNNIYLLKKSGLVSYSLLTRQRTTYRLPDFSFSHILIDLNGYTWISTTFDGILVIPPNNQITQFNVPFKFTSAIRAGSELFLTTTHGSVFALSTHPFSLEKVHQEKYNANNYDIILFPKNAVLDKRELGEYEVFTYKGKKYLVTKSGFKDAEVIDDSYLIAAFTGMVRMVSLHLKDEKSPWKNMMFKYRSVIDPGEKHFTHVADFLGGIRASHLVYDSLRKCIYLSSNLGIKQITCDTMADFTFRGQTIFAQNLFLQGNRLYMHLHTGKILIYDIGTGQFDPGNFHLPSSFSLVKLYDSVLFLANDKEFFRINLWDDVQVAMPIAFPFTENDFEDIAYIDRYYWIFGNGHIYRVKDTIHTRDELIPFYVHRIFSREKTFLKADVCRFNHNDNDITIEFSLLNYYRHPDKVEYKLNEDTWKSLNANQRSINFNSLAPGDYSIDFRIANMNYPKAVLFKILSPWYTRWYVFLSLLLGVALVSFLYYRSRLAAHRKENALILEKATLQRDL